jgi:hypothetical protein
MKVIKAKCLTTAFSVLCVTFLANQANAQAMNDPPPAGPVILDLNGSAVPHSYTTYTTSFIANSTATDFSFAFREDPAFLLLTNVQVTTGTGPNILLNGDFSLGAVPGNPNQPVDWTYLNVFNSFAAGVPSTNCLGPASCYFDGSVQAYDAITQSLTTTPGQLYNVSFSLDDDGGLTTFSALSTNGDTTDTGGNGIDLLVYAGNGVPTAPTPLPAALPLFAGGLGMLGLFGRRRKQKALNALPA